MRQLLPFVTGGITILAMFPTVGDVIAGAVWLGIAAGMVAVAVTGADRLELLDRPELPEPPPLLELPSAVRIIPRAPFDWQTETDL